jgi:hypothetical protein
LITDRRLGRFSFLTLRDPARIERFGRLMRHNLTNGSVPFRKAYLRSIIDIVEVEARPPQGP